MNIDEFTRSLLSIEVLQLGGAGAGIVGSSGNDSNLTYQLKQKAVAFANAYRSTGPSSAGTKQAADDVYGIIQSLLVTSTISEAKATELLNALDNLLEQ